MQCSVQKGKILVGWNDINVVGLNLHSVFNLDHRHGRGTLEQFHQDALMGRIQMLDDNKADSARFRYMGKKLLESFQPARRSAKPDDGKERA